MGSLASRESPGLQAAEQTQQTTTTPPPQPPSSLKPCCACPETKRARDACIIEKGEEHCGPLIEAHKECMRALGFKV